jgi:hypothetical protein
MEHNQRKPQNGRPLRVIHDPSCGLRLPLDVCFFPKATHLLRGNEMT